MDDNYVAKSPVYPFRVHFAYVKLVVDTPLEAPADSVLEKPVLLAYGAVLHAYLEADACDLLWDSLEYLVENSDGLRGQVFMPV